MSVSIDTVKPIPAEQVGPYEAWDIPVLNSANGIIITSEKRKGRKKQIKENQLSNLTTSGLEKLRNAAHDEGFNKGQKEGYQAGMQKAQVEINETMAHLNRIISQLMHPLTEQREELEQALVYLTSGIAKSIVKMEVDFDAESLLDMVGQAVNCLPEGSENIRILVHPRDAELMRKANQEQIIDWKVIADSSLVSGGCIVKTDFSYIDYTLDTQFKLTVDKIVNERLNNKQQGQSKELNTEARRS